MNRDGWTLLAMGFKGKKALEWKLKYIAMFNEMESQLQKPQFYIPQTYVEALQLATDLAKTVEQQEI